jgi:FdhD protein
MTPETKRQKTKTYPLVKIYDGVRQALKDEVVEEKPLSIYLNQQKLATLMCTPREQKALAIGFLFSEGFIEGRGEIKRVVYDSKNEQIKVFTVKKTKFPRSFLLDQTFTSGCGKRKSFTKIKDLNLLEDVRIDLGFTLSPDEIERRMKEFEVRSSVFKQTGGTHSSALASKEKILLFKEDIGRHNAVDKILGECLLKKIPPQDKLLLTSGRISSDILLKAHRAKINLIVSRSAVTSLAVDLAQKLGITLIGFARGKRMNIYTYQMRVSE